MIARVTRQIHIFCQNHNRNEIRGGTGQERPWGGVPGTVAWERQNDKSKDLSTIRWEGGTGQEAPQVTPRSPGFITRKWAPFKGTINSPSGARVLLRAAVTGTWC